MDLITLIGDIDENFYQLGLLDKKNGPLVHQDVKMMLRTPWKPVNLLMEEIAKGILKSSQLKKSSTPSHLKAYAEGMGISIEECSLVMLIPELVSAASKWAPGFLKGNLGCSSFISRNEQGEVIHGRILDFPLQGSYDLFERAISYNLVGMPKLLGFGSKGIPYPSITLMTEDGMTLALHQKFTNNFNPKGLSIFEFIFQMIKTANDKKSVLDFIKANQTLTTWCLYITFKNGDILACDLNGENSFINKYTLPDFGIMYFCNHLENKKIDQTQFLPLGFNQYNLMRESVAQEKINSFHKKKKTHQNPTELELLQIMSTPLPQKMGTNISHFRLDTITPSSLSVIVMNSTAQNALYLKGPAPKVFSDNVIEIKTAFNRPSLHAVKIKKSQIFDPEYQNGLRALMNAQKGFDSKNPIDLYHHLQMAVDYLENYPEKKIAAFYFLIAQFIYETNPKTLANLLIDFKNFENKLPPYLNDNCLLFIGRLEYILKMPPTLEEDKIQIKKLREIYQMELKIPRPLFHATVKNMLNPRIDILDIISLFTS